MNPSFAIIDNFVQLLIVIAAVGFVLIALVVPVAAIYFHHRKRQLWHETARLALEKGQPMPSTPVDADDAELKPPANASFAEWQAAKRAESRSHGIKGGLVLIGVGAGLYLFFGAAGGGQMRWMGAIPGFIGVALLLHAAFESLFAKSPRPPQS